MELKLTIDDNEPLYELLDSLIVKELKEQLSYCKHQIAAYKYKTSYVHEDDYKAAKKRKKAIKLLLEYYGH